MTCISCSSTVTTLVPNASGLLEPVCEFCQLKAARPEQLASGTQPGRDTLHALQDRAEAQQEIAVATARAEAALDALRTLVNAWRREMRGGFSTPEMQWALRRAEEMVK